MNEELGSLFPDSGLPRVVGDDENVIRFLKDSNSYNATKVKPQAFIPRPNKITSRWELSVFRDQNEGLEYWKHRNQTILSRSALHGIAKVKLANIRSLNLEVEADDNPPAHANIIGWPAKEDLTLDIAIVTALTQELANNAERFLYSV